MYRRWLGSVATLIASAGLAAAQAPLPADWAPSPAPRASAPVGVNGSPAPSAAVESPKPVKPSDLKPVVATADSGPAAQTPPAALPATNTPPGAPPAGFGGGPADLGTAPEAGLGFDDPGVPYRHVWGRAEYLLWYLKNMELRPVLGTVPNSDAVTGELPPGAITTVYGGETVNYGAQSGVRVELGVGIDRAADWGVSAEFFQLEHASRGASITSNSSAGPAGGPLFSDPVLGQEVVVYYLQPGVRDGTVESLDQNRLWGSEIDLRRRLSAIFSDRLDLIVGYRHIGFDESLDLSGTSNAVGTIPSPASQVEYADHFGVHNNFDGAVVGLESEYDVGCLFLDLRGKFGIGNVHEAYSINGSTSFVSTLPGTPSQQFNGGILAQPSNSGNFARNRFDFLGEITVNGGVRFWNDHAKAYVGYNFLGLSKVLRPGDLVDNVNSLGVPSLLGMDRSLAVSSPTQKVDDGRFWAEGLNLGLSFEF
jgi:hypothetical protein